MDGRQPFDAPGISTTGDGDATPLLPAARRAMFVAKLLASTAQVPVWRSGVVDPASGAVITTNIAGPIERLNVHVEQPKAAPPPASAAPIIRRQVWLPEGFMITPRTAAAPDGFGMPPTPDGHGTPGGPLRQAVINRFARNKYPAWPGSLFYMDWELLPSAGVMRLAKPDTAQPPADPLDPWIVQFEYRYKGREGFTEFEGGTWLCHRPASATENAVEQRFRTETNAVRASVGMPPLGPPLQGFKGELANVLMDNVRLTGVMGHSNPGFRDGYKTFADRINVRAGMQAVGGENIYFNSGMLAYDEAYAVQAVADWAASPGHYANMIEDWGSSGQYYASLDTSSITTVLSGQQDPPYEIDGPITPITPPTNARVACQIFTGILEWVHAVGTGMQHEVIGVSGRQDMFVQAYSTGPASAGMYDPFVTLHGRKVWLTPSSVDARLFDVVAATLVRDDTGRAVLRIAVLVRATTTAPRFMAIHEGFIDDFYASRHQVAAFQLNTADASLVGRPRFSASGARMVFSVLRLVDAPSGYLDSGMSPQVGSSGVLGHSISFVEWRDGEGFTTVHTGQLNINPVSFGPGVYSQEMDGECRLIAAYDDETIVYARIVVRASSSQATAGTIYTKQFLGILIFPDGTSINYAETRMDKESTLNAAAAYGYFRHFLPFDIMQPAGVAYVEYTLPNVDTEYLVGRLKFQGQVIKTAPNPLNYPSPGRLGYVFDGSYLNRQNITTLSVHRGVTDAVGFHTRIPNAFTPTVPYPCTLVSWGRETAPRSMPRGLAGEVSSVGFMEYVLSGPVIVGDGIFDGDDNYQRVEQLRYAHYKGEFLLAGRLESTLGPVGSDVVWNGSTWVDTELGAWKGEDQWYRISTLDLPEITGIDDLAQNILPIGVL